MPSQTARVVSENIGDPKLARTALSEAFADALSTPDLARARELTRVAAASGIDAGRLYTDIIRPAMVHVARGPDAAVRLAAGISLTLLADALEVEAPPLGHGTGRAALVAYEDCQLQALDGEAISAFLSWTGWRVSRLSPETVGPTPSDLDRGGALELAVIVVDPEAPVAALAPVCNRVRRVPDPPVIVLVDFAGRLHPRAALLALGGDEVVGDPKALLRAALARSPAPGCRRWGVSMRRSGDTLTVTPTGSLNAENAGRLAEVATTRAGTYRRLAIDLRDLSDIDAGGIDGLVGWPGMGAVDRELLVDTAVRGALHRVTVAGWRLTEPAAA